MDQLGGGWFVSFGASSILHLVQDVVQSYGELTDSGLCELTVSLPCLP